MIDNTMRNTFGVLTNRMTIADVLDMYTGEDAMFYGNPLNITDEEIKDMIEYFESTEEYEYCAQLKELLNAKNFADLDMLLDKLAEENGITLQ